MCYELVGIALCAPDKPGQLTFNCGRLHTIAAKRQTCPDAKGSCPCFFGTCGKIETTTATDGLDFSALPKVRCAGCTTKEDAVGQRRSGVELADSPLLNRFAIPESAIPIQMTVLKNIWGGAETCPFESHRTTPATVVGPPSSPSVASSTKSASDAAINKSPQSAETTFMKPDTDEDIAKRIGTSGIAPHPGILTSRWANAPAEPAKPAKAISKTKQCEPRNDKDLTASKHANFGGGTDTQAFIKSKSNGQNKGKETITPTAEFKAKTAELNIHKKKLPGLGSSVHNETSPKQGSKFNSPSAEPKTSTASPYPAPTIPATPVTPVTPAKPQSVASEEVVTPTKKPSAKPNCTGKKVSPGLAGSRWAPSPEAKDSNTPKRLTATPDV